MIDIKMFSAFLKVMEKRYGNKLLNNEQTTEILRHLDNAEAVYRNIPDGAGNAHLPSETGVEGEGVHKENKGD